MLLRCSEALAQLQFAAFTRRALRPSNVASGDRCVRGTLPPRHHAGTNNLLSKAPGATGRKAALVPRHYRIAPPGDRPRKAPSAASGRRPVVTGRCASDRPPDEHPPARIIVSSARVASMSGRPGFATRGTLRPLSTAIRAAPASRRRDRPPAPPRCGRGPPALRRPIRPIRRSPRPGALWTP